MIKWNFYGVSSCNKGNYHPGCETTTWLLLRLLAANSPSDFASDLGASHSLSPPGQTLTCWKDKSHGCAALREQLWTFSGSLQCLWWGKHLQSAAEECLWRGVGCPLGSGTQSTVIFWVHGRNGIHSHPAAFLGLLTPRKVSNDRVKTAENEWKSLAPLENNFSYTLRFFLLLANFGYNLKQTLKESCH